MTRLPAVVVLVLGCSAVGSRPPEQTGPATVGCDEASRELRAAMDQAAQGCSAERPCVVFESCHPVRGDAVAELEERRTRTLNACRGQPEGSGLLSCGREAVCVNQRCQFPLTPTR